jgi:copper homeostasis protein (lipoprotein)
MTGISIARALAMGAFAATLALAGCKKGKDTTTAVEEKREPPPPSGTLSLQGTYAYVADAGLFVDCATREQWPVATEGDNAALELAYREAKVAPGSPLLVTVQGRLGSRPKVDGRGKETHLIVDRFVRTWPRETCGSMSKVTLENTRWELLELNATTITVAVDDKAPYLELNPKKASAYGFGGCNRFFGSYKATERTLEFGAMGATRMACPEGMQQEQELFRALDSTTRYEIHGSKLLLFSGDSPVARFEARDKPAEP